MTAPALPVTLPSAATMPETIKAALPALTVMLVNGALAFLAAILILAVGWTIARWAGRWTHNAIRHVHYVDDTLKPLISNGVFYGVLAITIVAVLGQFGVQTTSLIAVLGAAGLAIGLALQGTLSNVASGVMLLFLRPFRVLEKIVVTGITGTVREIGLFRTEMVTDDGLFVSIPNSSIFSGIIINASREPTRRTDFSVDIDRDADIPGAERAVLDALARDERVLRNPPARVVVDNLNGPQVLLTVQAWVANHDFTQVQSELRLLTRRALNEASVSPPVPVPAPAVAPWTPPQEAQPPSGDAKSRPN
jgi:small conductance mechanosensitive channel